MEKTAEERKMLSAGGLATPPDGGPQFPYELAEDKDGQLVFVSKDGIIGRTIRTEAGSIYPIRELPWLPASANFDEYPWADESYIFAGLVGFFERYLYFRDARQYKVLASWTLSTYLLENWRVAPPLYLLGPTNSGKTTTLECLEQLSFRGVRSGSMSQAVMFRLDDLYHPSYLLDESQIYGNRKTEGMAETQALINERYRRGGKVWRMMGESHSMTPTPFGVFGFSAFASNYPPWEALSSRALLFKMEKNTNSVGQTLTYTFEAKGRELRTWLLQHRFRNLRTYRTYDLGDSSGQVNDPVQTMSEELSDYRTREVGYPLLAVTPEGDRSTILSFLKDLEKQHQADENTADLADYVLALSKCEPDAGKASAQAVRYQLALLWEAVIVNDSTPQVDSRRVPTAKTVMKMLRTLGFSNTRMSNGATGVLWDQELLDRLRSRYHV